jgi:hypothetical protein
MSFSFLKFFGKAKVDELNQSLKEQLVKMCPETATAAELAAMDEQLVKLTDKLQELKSKMKKELGEAEIAKTSFNENLEICNVLQKRIDAGENVKENTEALNQLVADMEIQKSDVEREIEEAEAAKVTFEEYEVLVNQYSEKVKSARRNIEAAKNKVERAQIKQMNALEKERQAKEKAGLLKNMSATNTVLDTFNKIAEDAENKALASESRAALFNAPKSNSVVDSVRNELNKTEKPASTSEKLKTFSKF